MENLLKVFGVEYQRLNGASEQLRELSSAFHSTGNMDMAIQLRRIAFAIQKSATAIDGAIGTAVADTVNKSFQASANMLNASLAGATVALKMKEENVV
jgi:hypothetical protein